MAKGDKAAATENARTPAKGRGKSKSAPASAAPAAPARGKPTATLNGNQMRAFGAIARKLESLANQARDLLQGIPGFVLEGGSASEAAPTQLQSSDTAAAAPARRSRKAG